MAITISGKEYVMRSLKTRDAFALSRILKKMKIRPDVVQGATQEQVGADLIMQFVSHLGDAETEVCGFISDLIGMKPEVFLDLELEETIKIIEAFKSQKGLASFFSSVARLMK